MTEHTSSHLHLVPRGLREEIEQTFTPWHQSPKEIARLYRWLDEMMNEAPVDVPRFIEEAHAYKQNYEDMLMWTGRAS